MNDAGREERNGWIVNEQAPPMLLGPSFLNSALYVVLALLFVAILMVW